MKVILSHPTGNANVRAAAYGMANADILGGFHTSVASFEGSLLYKIGKIKMFSDIRRRRYDHILKPYTRTWPEFEIARMLANKLHFPGLIRHEKGVFCIDAVYKNLDKQTAKIIHNIKQKNIDAVYAYEDGAELTFRKAKQQGIQCLYDLPIGYWRSARRLLAGEKERWPEWFSTITGFEDSEIKLQKKDEELALADRIFVASRFTARTLEEYPGKLAPVEVIPYGFPPVSEQAKSSGKSLSGPLKILYVGSLSQRKGVADLIEATKKLQPHVTLTLVGHKVTEGCAPLNHALAAHKWYPTLPHSEVLQLMRTSDVLVFPSLFEGFGLVITEAMSQGTPVITTERTAGPDVISHGEEGWITQAGILPELMLAIEKLISNRKIVSDAGKAALERARLRPWKIYESELANAVQRHLSAQ